MALAFCPGMARFLLGGLLALSACVAGDTVAEEFLSAVAESERPVPKNIIVGGRAIRVEEVTGMPLEKRREPFELTMKTKPHDQELEVAPAFRLSARRWVAALRSARSATMTIDVGDWSATSLVVYRWTSDVGWQNLQTTVGGDAIDSALAEVFGDKNGKKQGCEGLGDVDSHGVAQVTLALEEIPFGFEPEQKPIWQLVGIIGKAGPYKAKNPAALRECFEHVMLTESGDDDVDVLIFAVPKPDASATELKMHVTQAR
jgi:hypothetical protein